MTTTGDKIAAHASSKKGSPYQWGAKGPDKFDCSGLAIWCHSQENISISGNAESLSKSGTSVTDKKPGDLLFYACRDGSSAVSHVGIYIGNNKMVHAPGDGQNVKEANINSKYWTDRFKGAKRYWKEE